MSDRVHLESTTGARPSSGAASSDWTGAEEYSGAPVLAEVAAPEDGRAPPWRPKMVVLSKMHSRPQVASF